MDPRRCHETAHQAEYQGGSGAARRREVRLGSECRGLDPQAPVTGWAAKLRAMEEGGDMGAAR